MTDAAKHDEGKVPLELFPRQALTDIGKVLAFGAAKYGPDNWRKGMAWRRLGGAALRHLTAWLDSEDVDDESGLSHLAHAGCCIAFLLEYEARRLGTDDRWRPEVSRG